MNSTFKYLKKRNKIDNLLNLPLNVSEMIWTISSMERPNQLNTLPTYCHIAHV